MSSSATKIPSPPPLLPPELIDEILRENELSNSDLARCCLVSHQFLPSARQSLYNKLRVLLEYEFDQHRGRSWFYLRSSWKLLRTLEEKPLLGKLCCELLVGLGLNIANWKQEAVEPDQVIRKWLGLLKSVRHFSSSLSTSDKIPLGERRWSTLHLRLHALVGSIPPSIQASGVKRLKLHPESFSDAQAQKELAIPPSVVTFDYSLMRGWKLLPATNLRLRNLLINENQANSIEFSRFPNLAHLLISQHGFSEINPNCLSGLTHLRRLSLKIGSHGGLNPSDRLHSPLSNLPSSIYRLDFHDSIPFEILTTILDDDSLSITQLGLSQWVNSDSTQKQKVDDLKELCQRRGIDIYYVGRENPVFGML
ncbi:hypothetical protein JCM3765_004337 [Sporobolomyces pararoseus]